MDLPPVLIHVIFWMVHEININLAIKGYPPWKGVASDFSDS